MGYPFGYYQPPPPPPHPNLIDPNVSYRGLNVTDPRFAAKYGNPYLRNPPTEVPPHMPVDMAEGSPQMPPRGYPYATLNNRGGGGYGSPNMGQHAKSNVNYTGTMIGNGNKTGSGASRSGGATSGGNKSSQYIVSPDADVKNDAMATHV